MLLHLPQMDQWVNFCREIVASNYDNREVITVQRFGSEHPSKLKDCGEGVQPRHCHALCSHARSSSGALAMTKSSERMWRIGSSFQAATLQNRHFRPRSCPRIIYMLLGWLAHDIFRRVSWRRFPAIFVAAFSGEIPGNSPEIRGAITASSRSIFTRNGAQNSIRDVRLFSWKLTKSFLSATLVLSRPDPPTLNPNGPNP